jgi:rhomboid family protein
MVSTIAAGPVAASSTLTSFVQRYALVPCQHTAHCAVVAGAPYPLWITLFTSKFLHGGWSHIIGNMIYLYVFGNHVERSMEQVPYVAF